MRMHGIFLKLRESHCGATGYEEEERINSFVVRCIKGDGRISARQVHFCIIHESSNHM